MPDFQSILDESEILIVPAKLRPFLERKRTPDAMQSWGAYSYGFSEAFDELYQVAAMAAPGRDYLLPPVAFMARHSIEIAMKEAIEFAAQYSEIGVVNHGHDLTKIWKHLLEHVTGCGYPTDDEWTRYCAKLVKHIGDLDSGAMRFRYPADKNGNLYDPTSIDLEGLGKAHLHITSYCGAVVSQIDASLP